MQRTFTKQPVTATTAENREYHACQVSLDIAVPVDSDIDVEEIIADQLEEYASQTGEIIFLGSNVEDMDHAYSDKDIEHFI